MRILGIDPGIGRAGWGVVDESGGKVTVIDYGCVETPKEHSLEQRIETLYDAMTKIIVVHKPAALAIESLFFNKNVSTAIAVGQARGVVLLAAAQNKISVTSYTPQQVKIGVTGYGKADKNQVGQMVKMVLRLHSLPKPDDTADALAIAVTHAFSYKVK
jgi:crossover junction endodeoxyribonuclease RuvC